VIDLAALGRGVNISGHRFGRLVAQFPLPNRTPEGKVIWVCLCDCGNTTHFTAAALRYGDMSSCGCYRTDKMVTHGLSHVAEHVVWEGMIQRCCNPKAKHFKYYGGRGISICARWRNDFGAFYADMGPRPDPSFTIDRINNDGHYEPGNCRWATKSEQASNCRPRKLHSRRDSV
jgi:hypothetical protein